MLFDNLTRQYKKKLEKFAQNLLSKFVVKLIWNRQDLLKRVAYLLLLLVVVEARWWLLASEACLFNPCTKSRRPRFRNCSILLFVVCCQYCHCLYFIICCLLSILLFVFCILYFIICCLFVVCCLYFIIYWFDVCCVVCKNKRWC